MQALIHLASETQRSINGIRMLLLRNDAFRDLYVVNG